MKTVGKQLEEARLARDWTPELAARETKIKVERVRDLEADDYSHFTSPTYARGFVRTYARALGLDEYRILRQLDNRLPDDDSANIVTDGGVAYLPETALPPRAAHRDYTGLYVVMGLGVVVGMAIVIVLVQAYRVGELPRYFKSNQETAAIPAPATTNADGAPTTPTGDTVARALPIDSNTPPPVPETNAPPAAPVPAPVVPVALAPPVTNSPTAETAPAPVSPRALPVDPNQMAAPADNNAAVPPIAPRALPVDPNADANSVSPSPTPAPNPAALTPPADPAPVVAKAPPRALPVTDADLAAATSANPTPAPVNPRPAMVTPVPQPSANSNSGPVVAPPVAPVIDDTPAAPQPDPGPKPATDSTGDATKRLVLTASQDSFVRVTSLDSPDSDKPLYAAVLHSGQSVGFDGRKFAINVGIPSAVNIRLDGVNYGPHSDQDSPESFVVQSHQP